MLLLDPPSPAKITYFPPIVIKGKTVSIDCSVDHPGRPDNITFVWRRGQHKLDTTTSNLNFTANLASRSNFSCYAVNDGGSSNTATTFINVSGILELIHICIPFSAISLFFPEHYHKHCVNFFSNKQNFIAVLPFYWLLLLHKNVFQLRQSLSRPFHHTHRS